MAIGEKIKSLRLSKGLTQKQLGELCGMADSAIRRYELGGANPKIDTLFRIADALSVSLSELSDNFVEIPEIKTDIYGPIIKSMISSIEEGPCCISKKSADKLLKKLNTCVTNGNKIKDSDELSDFYWDSELTFSHEYLNSILEQYSDQSVYDLVILLNYFLSLTNRAQDKVQEYVLDLYEIPEYKKN